MCIRDRALTNYVGQSVWGMVLFYGIGFGLGAGIGLTGTESIAFYVFLVQMAFKMCIRDSCKGDD